MKNLKFGFIALASTVGLTTAVASKKSLQNEYVYNPTANAYELYVGAEQGRCVDGATTCFYTLLPGATPDANGRYDASEVTKIDQSDVSHLFQYAL